MFCLAVLSVCTGHVWGGEQQGEVTHAEKGVPAVGEIPSEADLNTAVLETGPRWPTGSYQECEMWKIYIENVQIFHSV